MSTMTLDRVLTAVESLPDDEQAMLEELLRKRRVEKWRRDTAAEGRKAIRNFRAGRVKSAPVEDVIARLHAGI